MKWVFINFGQSKAILNLDLESKLRLIDPTLEVQHLGTPVIPNYQCIITCTDDKAPDIFDVIMGSNLYSNSQVSVR